MVTYRRKSYRRRDGTKVKSALVTTKGSGKSRGRKTGGKYKEEKKWITKIGKLGGSGFLTKTSTEQHKLLNNCVKKYGYRSCLGSLMVLNKNKIIKEKHGKKINSLVKYLKNKYSKRKSR
jgi:hypothetical protein